MPIMWKAIAHDLTFGSTLEYNTNEPFAIHFAFRDEFKTEWLISRDLIKSGLETTAGEGDVLCWSSDERFFLLLRNPYHSILLSASLGSVEYFLNQTYFIMPEGSERVDIDALLERLFE